MQCSKQIIEDWTLPWLSESSLENSVLDRWRIYEITFSNYVRARSACNVIPYLFIKLEEDLKLPILQLPNTFFLV